MSQSLATEPIPLAKDGDDVLRVGGTRVPLEDFPVLKLDDIYAVLTYYLRHREEVQAHLSQRERLAGVRRTPQAIEGII
jgi:hypothetical protein